MRGCAGVLAFPGNTAENPLIVPPAVYKECVRRWGKEEVEKMHIKEDQKAK